MVASNILAAAVKVDIEDMFMNRRELEMFDKNILSKRIVDNAMVFSEYIHEIDKIQFGRRA